MARARSSKTGKNRRRAGCLLPWLAAMLLIGSVPYLALYTGFFPGLDILDDAGIDVRSPVGAVVAGVALVFAIATLAWCFSAGLRAGRKRP